MEAEERPSKMRKLSHEGSAGVESHNPNGVAASGTANGADDISASAIKSDMQSGDLASKVQQDAHRPEQNGSVTTKQDVGPATEDQFPPPHEIAPLAESRHENVEAPPMSKNALKKLRKKQEWESKREERKAVRKEKTTAKRERKRETRLQEALARGEDPSKPPEQPKKPPVQKAVTLPITILIDCDFDDLMRDNERISLAAQVTRSYSDNKNSLYRAHLAVCSFGGKLRERFDNILTHYKSWRGVRFLDSDFVNAAQEAKGWMHDEQNGGKMAGVFSGHAEVDEAAQAKLKDEGEIVYLSSESDETLTELKPYSTYIIGGLVDKNREKGICYKRATQRGVRTAKLPIGDFLEMSSRKVLATNHVNEIMLKWLECGDWGQAFLKVIPKRKGGKLKGAEQEAEEEGDDTVCDPDHEEVKVDDVLSKGEANTQPEDSVDVEADMKDAADTEAKDSEAGAA